MELKLKIKEELLKERDRKLNEAFEEFKDISQESFVVERYIKISAKLLDEGYTINELEATDVSKQLNSVDWKGALSSGAVSGAKEYIIRFVLSTIFGKNHPDIITTASIILADVNPLHLLKPFKDEQSCIQYFPKISDGIVEAIVRYFGGKQINVDRNDYGIGFKGISTTLGGNIIGDIIKQSNLGETISNNFCKFIH